MFLLAKKLEKKTRDARAALKKEIADIADPIILKAATAESRHTSQQRNQTIQNMVNNLQAALAAAHEKWNILLLNEESERATTVRSDLAAFSTELEQLKLVSGQINNIAIQIVERPNNGSCSASSAKEDCTRLLRDQINLEEQIFVPQYQALQTRMQNNAQAMNEFAATVAPDLPIVVNIDRPNSRIS